jgi:hypothetical protein
MRLIPRRALLVLSLAACAPAAPRAEPMPSSPDVFAALQGSWTGVLEYSDYRNGRRVQLPTRVTAVAAEQGRMLTMDFVYREPNGSEVTSRSVHRMDLAAGRYVMEGDTFAVSMVEGFAGARGGQLVLSGTVEENDRPEPARHTFTLRGDTLSVLKETRSPLQFRNEHRLVRVP